MELTCQTISTRKGFASLKYALPFFSLWACWFALTDLHSLLWLPLLGSALISGLEFLPKKAKSITCLAISGTALLYLLCFFTPVRNSLATLANRIFALSESRQAYEYDYFTFPETAPVWGLSLLCLLTAVGVSYRKSIFLLPMTALSLGAMAYFGITPSPLWLTLLLVTLLTAAVPFWKQAVPAAALALLLSLVLGWVGPSVPISAAEERLRDHLALHSVTYESIPEPTQMPEPEPTEPPEIQFEEVGVKNTVNVLFLVLAALTLLLLFFPAVVKDRAQKRRDKQRADFTAPDPATAIRAMYLHGNKWKAAAAEPRPCPKEIYTLWQEAAYSDHPLTEAQRETMRAYLDALEQEIWETADRKTRFRIRYQLAL